MFLYRSFLMTYTAEELERKEGMPKNDFAFCW
jgi:hypothetical protein